MDVKAWAASLWPFIASLFLEASTFTSTYFGSSTAGTTTYTTQYGAYLKVANFVIAVGRVTWTNATGTGNGQIGGLPYATANPSASVFAVMSANISYTNAGLRAFTGNGIQFLQLFDQTTGAFAASAIDTAGDIIFAGVYPIA